MRRCFIMVKVYVVLPDGNKMLFTGENDNEVDQKIDDYLAEEYPAP